jgi:2-amino-4-hydroxy-6-hydroxymethyldihydropteridine diphosphokinase
MTMARAGIALGSNLGDRMQHLIEGIKMLRTLATPGEPFLVASSHETAPWSCPAGSPMFLNTVVEMAYAGEATQLLGALLDLEKQLGRVRGPERNAPRVIDLDLLYFDSLVMESEFLTLPHPRIAERRFVLEPLSEIRPELVLPGFQWSVRDALEMLLANDRRTEILAVHDSNT